MNEEGATARAWVRFGWVAATDKTAEAWIVPIRPDCPLTIEVSRQATTGGESAFDRLQVHIRAYLRADMGVAQPSHFVVITGIRL